MGWMVSRSLRRTTRCGAVSAAALIGAKGKHVATAAMINIQCKNDLRAGFMAVSVLEPRLPVPARERRR